MDPRATTVSSRRAVVVLGALLALLVAACDVTDVGPPTGAPASAAIAANPGSVASVSPSANPTASPAPTESPTPRASVAPSPTPRPTPRPPASSGSAAAFAPCPGRIVTAGSGPSGDNTSTNWSGYAATAASGGITCVEATWTQPTIRCTSARTAISIWVGLGGFDQDGLEQIGSEVDCSHGRPNGYLWHESLPFEHYEVPIDLGVRRGDRLRAQVRAVGSATYQLSIANLTHGTVFTVRDVNPRLARTSAEWVAEAPTGGCPLDCRVLPMPDFGTIAFSGTWLTVDGAREPLDGVDVTHVRIAMLAPDGSIRASVSTTSSSGTSFSVAWRRA